MISEWCTRASMIVVSAFLCLFFSGCFGGSYFVLVSYFFFFFILFLFGILFLIIIGFVLKYNNFVNYLKEEIKRKIYIGVM